VTPEIMHRSAAEAAESLRRREMSSRELTEMLLAWIDAVNPALNAVVELRAEAALEDAAAADRAITRGAASPLHGVPMTIKEGFNVAGLHTTWGNPAFKDYVADSDATVVRRLKQAGAVIVGKTNIAFILGDYGQTANELCGVSNNPWNTTHTPGGSSGGAAAAVSAGLTFLEYGSDLVGSIRIPASFCGVYGLRPSVELVPLTGFQPTGVLAGPSEMTYMSAVGPLGRSPGDLRTTLELTAGPEPPASKAYAWGLGPPRRTRLADFRVGVVLDDDHAPVSSEVTSLLSEVVDALARAGATVAEGWPADIDPAREAESFAFHLGLFFACQQPAEEFGTPSELIEHENRRMSARAAWCRYFDDIDVFVCPTNFTPAFPHDRRPFEQRTVATPQGERPYDRQPFWIAHASLPGLPALSAPIGRTPDGLPVGAQIIGPLYEDDTPLTFAELLAELIGGYERPPV
jgi:amidase